MELLDLNLVFHRTGLDRSSNLVQSSPKRSLLDVVRLSFAYTNTAKAFSTIVPSQVMSEVPVQASAGIADHSCSRGHGGEDELSTSS